jgi:hypothetical protein
MTTRASLPTGRPRTVLVRGRQAYRHPETKPPFSNIRRRGMIDKDTFLSIVKSSGLEMSDSHLQELYTYVEKLFPNFKVAEGIDLKETEPMLTLVLPKE